MLLVSVARYALYALASYAVYMLARLVYHIVGVNVRRARYYADVPTLSTATWAERALPMLGKLDLHKIMWRIWRDNDAQRNGAAPRAFLQRPRPNMSRCAVVATKPDDIRFVLMNTNSTTLAKTPLFKELLAPMLGNGLVTSDGALWHSQRKLLTPLFHFRQLRRVGPIVSEQIDAFMPRFERELATYGSPIELLEALTLRVIVAVAFGRDFDCVKMATQWHTTTRALLPYFAGRLLLGRLFDRLPFGAARRFLDPLYAMRADVRALAARRYRELVAERDAGVVGKRTAAAKADADEAAVDALGGDGHDVGDDAAADEKSAAAASNITGSDLLDCMLRSIVERGAPLDVTLVEDESMTFLLAGHETSSSLLAWALYFLAANKDAQDAAAAELKAELGGAAATVEALPRLRYVRAVLDESLRLRPPAPSVQRHALVDVTLPHSGVTVKAGDDVGAAFMLMHTDTETWGADARQFRPARWLDEAARAKRHPWSFLPFSGGPRNCIGSRFALQESALVLIALLQRFEIELDPSSNVTMDSVLTVQPGDLRVRMLKRQC